MQTLVTGGAGFIGGHIVERLLAAGNHVRVLLRDQSKGQWLQDQGAELYCGDITDLACLQRAAEGADVVFHLAAFVSEWGPWERFQAVTVAGTENMLAAAAAAKVPRFLHVSTATVYDDAFARRARVIHEDAPLGARGDRAYGNYSKAKVLAERAVWQAQAEGKTQVTVVRPAWVYGPRDFTILPRLCEHLKGPLSCWIGNKNPVVDPIFVTDVAECAVLAAMNPIAAGKAYNVAPQAEIRLREFLGTLCRELQIRPPRWTMPYSLALAATVCCESWARVTQAINVPSLTMAGLASFTVDQHFSSDKALRELGWAPQVTLEEGVARTAEWLSVANPSVANH